MLERFKRFHALEVCYYQKILTEKRKCYRGKLVIVLENDKAAILFDTSACADKEMNAKISDIVKMVCLGEEIY